MGLDQYMYKRAKGADLPDDSQIYWRKANFVRAWFVEHTGYRNDADCEEHIVTKKQLEALVSDCRKVLADHKLAPKLMPTCAGFFFGGTEYDDYYFDMVAYTAEEVEKLIHSTNFETEEVIYYEWW